MRPGRTVIFAWTVIAWSGPWRIAKSKRLKDFAIAAERAISATVTPPTSKNWQADRGVREGNARCVPTAPDDEQMCEILGVPEETGTEADYRGIRLSESSRHIGRPEGKGNGMKTPEREATPSSIP